MKKLIIVSAIAMSGLFYNTANAQVRLSFGFRFAPRRVVYAPSPVVVEQVPVYNQPDQVYDNNNDDYYYLPDVDAYYDVNAQCYYYNDGADWVSAAYLPGEYRNYDWRSARRFEVRAPRPYLHDNIYRSRFNGREAGMFVNNNYNRGRDEHFDNHGQWENRQHFDNRGQDNNREQMQNNRGQWGNDQHFDNHGQGQPSNQNNGREWGNRGGNNEHFAQNQRGEGSEHRMSRF
ncbi:hypothetical protein JN11_03242 [Mucilaginibacter frigoritolerans]|uniref:YXWGXW repeat-containing protein n=1 Tax=Mucilaginibacter frigoritolerans TaxID=652788 RepID=A0A562TXF5_9SPHI|nr:hypothetical protein [Mucilaginibacter frigoritolerans]TWI98163.1 hypothetical protein JN11_03242 [Mucilaginibacter frigoritolerans]